jgi:outer membrane protein TolC
MIALPQRKLRAGALLALVAALILFAARIATAQQPAPAAVPAAGADTLPPLRLTFGDAVRLAAAQSPAVQAARQRVAQAEARVIQRRADLLPNVSAAAVQSGRTFNTATFGIEFPTAPGQKPLFDPNGQVEGPVKLLDIRGKVQANLFDFAALARIRSARTAVSAVNADVSNNAEQAAALAASGYVRTLRAQALVSARAADSVLAAELLQIARDQLQAGVGIGLDVTRAQSQLAASRAQLLSARNERDRAALDLTRVLGLPAGTPVIIADSLAALALPDASIDEAAAVAEALRSRADLRAIDAQVAATRQAVNAIRAERLPSLGVVADQGVIGKNASHLLNTYTWGVQLSLPIFDGFRREGRVQEQQAVAGELDVRRRDLAAQAAIEVRGALLDIGAGRELVAAAQERLRFATQELAQARERFQAGVAGNADVITASLSLNAARTQLVDALAALQGARVSLARAQGHVTDLQ